MGDVDSPERYGSAIAQLASKGGRDYRVLWVQRYESNGAVLS